MTRERIEDFREIVLPFLRNVLLKTNYENMGKSDAEEFARDFNEILDMAIKALKQEPTPKNDLGVDCISRQAVLEGIAEWIADGYADSEADCSHISSLVTHLPSVTPQEPQIFKWCTDCKEYDQEKHCCHRWSKVIRDTVEEMKQEPKTGHCKDCKRWKDSDGAYRRGVGAESQCPINRKEVFEGSGYCYLFEPQESEET